MFYTKRSTHNILYSSYENWLREKTKWLRSGIAHSWLLVWVNVIFSRHASVQFAHLLNFTFSTWSRRLAFYLYVLNWMRYSLFFSIHHTAMKLQVNRYLHIFLVTSISYYITKEHPRQLNFEYFQKNIQVNAYKDKMMETQKETIKKAEENRKLTWKAKSVSALIWIKASEFVVEQNTHLKLNCFDSRVRL